MDGPNQETQGEDHVYLDVIHVPDVPSPRPSTTALCGSVVDLGVAGSEPDSTERRRRRFSVLNIVLFSLLLIMAVVCCVIIVLYVNKIGIKESVNEKHDSLENAVDEDSTEMTECSNPSEPDCKRKRKDEANRRIDKCITKSIMFNQPNSNNRVKIYGAPSMTAITVCFRVKVNQTNKIQYLSYVEPNGKEGFHIGDRGRHTSVNFDNKWQFVCWKWSSQDGKFTLYKDGRIVQEGSFKKNQTINGGGMWILGETMAKVKKSASKRSKRRAPKTSESSEERKSEEMERKAEEAEQRAEKSEQKSEKMEQEAERETEKSEAESEKSEAESEKSEAKSEAKSEKSEAKSQKSKGKSVKSKTKSQKFQKSKAKSRKLEAKSKSVKPIEKSKKSKQKSRTSKPKKRKLLGDLTPPGIRPGKPKKKPKKIRKGLLQKSKPTKSGKPKTKPSPTVSKLPQGEMIDINIWDKQLSQKQILKILGSCTSKYKGNIKSWNDFKSSATENIKVLANPVCCSK